MFAIQDKRPEVMNHSMVRTLVSLLDDCGLKERRDGLRNLNTSKMIRLDIKAVLELPSSTLMTVLCALLITELEVSDRPPRSS